jgi:hypothetical protein
MEQSRDELHFHGASRQETAHQRGEIGHLKSERALEARIGVR